MDTEQLSQFIHKWAELEPSRCCINSNGVKIIRMGLNKYMHCFSAPGSLDTIQGTVQEAIADRHDWVAIHGFGPCMPNGTATHGVTIHPSVTSCYSAENVTPAIAWLDAYLQAIESELSAGGVK